LNQGQGNTGVKELAKEVVEAPITGTIISIEVKVGDIK